MGGNAFNHIGEKSERMDIELFNEIQDKVIEYFSSRNIKISKLAYVREKDSFGDVDLVVEDTILFEDLLADYTIKNGFLANSNGNIISVLYEGKYQIDFITVESRYFDFAVNYFSNNDFSNIMGRIAKSYGYKLGWNGLFYVYRCDRFIRDIPLSSNYYDIFDILGIDSSVYKKGFDTFDDMFGFICECRYIKPEKFELENLPNKDRVRDRKRPTYNKFIDYIKSGIVNRSLNMVTPVERYPHLQVEIDKLDLEMKKHEEFHAVFNGSIVSELSGFQGKELGVLMKMLRTLYDDHDLKYRLPELVRSLI